MEKSKVDRLTSALESAGFEVISLKEETGRHLLTEHDLRGDIYVRANKDWEGGTCMNMGWTLDFKSGAVLLEVTEKSPSVLPS
jgi:hypothetical protein